VHIKGADAGVSLCCTVYTNMLVLLPQVMCFPSNHLAKLKASTRSSTAYTQRLEELMLLCLWLGLV
jgi:hypothetical protein